MKYSIVIPCYNEEENLPKLVNSLIELSQGKDVEFLLVENGSKDNSYELMKKLTNEIPYIRIIKVDNNRGLGYGIPQCEYYERKVVQPNNSTNVIQFKKESIGFRLVIADENEQYGCKLIPVFSLHELQYEVDCNQHFKMTLTPFQEQEICKFENCTFFGAKVIEELPGMMEQFKIHNRGFSLSDKIKHVANHYGIAEPVAIHYLHSIHDI